MGLFSRKTVKDEIKKMFLENNTTIDGVNPFSFQLNLSRFTLFPYVTLEDGKENVDLHFMINIRKIETLTNNVYLNINSFNLKSKYLTCKLSEENVIVLEYNTNVNTDNVKEILNDIIESVFNLEDLIDSL